MKIILFDLETNNLLEKVSTIHCAVTCDAITGEMRRFNSQDAATRALHNSGTIEEFLDYVSDADIMVAHNGVNYDRPVLRKLHPNRALKAKSICTIVLGKLIWPDLLSQDFNQMRALKAKGFPGNFCGAHKLKAWGYRLGVLKGTFEETDSTTLGGSKWEKWTQPMEDYCVQDVVVLKKLYDLCREKRPSAVAVEIEHGFAEIMQLQEVHGFVLDKVKAVALYVQLCERRLAIEADMKIVFPSKWETTKTPEYYQAERAVPGDRTGLVEKTTRPTKGELLASLKVLGWKLKDSTITPGPMKKKEIEFNPGSRTHIAQRFQERGWKPMAFTEDGRIKIDEEVLSAMVYPEAKFLLEYLLVVKRIGQVAEGDKAWLKLCVDGADGVSRVHGRVNPNGAATGRVTHSSPNMGQVPSVDSLYGEESRECFTVRPGYKLVGCDATGIQLRCLAHYMGRYDNGAYVKVVTTGDIHSVNQSAAGLPNRPSAKTFIYAFLFGAGDELIGAIIGKDAKAGRAIKFRFLRNLPALEKLKEAVDDAIDEGGFILGLDGRRIVTKSKHSGLNYLLQGAEAVIMKKANCLVYQRLTAAGLVWGRDWAQVLFCHDEFQFEVLPEFAQLVGETARQAIVDAGLFFNLRCPLDGAFKVGDNWKMTH